MLPNVPTKAATLPAAQDQSHQRPSEGCALSSNLFFLLRELPGNNDGFVWASFGEILKGVGCSRVLIGRLKPFIDAFSFVPQSPWNVISMGPS